ncbi:C40 family peptidase [Polymorphobacter sp.]|uniref:C40 family peptidase n=1 Tax=Polymorphobacter sp. TaxID=1909290 RepID=UPI003F71961B
MDVLAAVRLQGPRPRLDPRNHVARPDLVDIALAGQVAAARYTAPQPMVCAWPQVPMRGAADVAASAVSELLHGEGFDLFDIVEDWGFGRSAYDRYTGWVPIAALAEPASEPALPHRITARSAPLFSAPDIKSAIDRLLPMGSHISAVPAGRFLALTGGGFIHAAHAAPLAGPDLLSVARRFLGAPYVWGGRSPHGVDCSGLVQASLGLCGVSAPRDSDQQRDGLGIAMPFEARAAGDLIFFPGHVGIIAPGDRLLHANAHWMTVCEEPLADVLGRLGDGAVLAVKRLPDTPVLGR